MSQSNHFISEGTIRASGDNVWKHFVSFFHNQNKNLEIQLVAGQHEKKSRKYLLSWKKGKTHLKKSYYKHCSELFKTETHILEIYIYLLVSVENKVSSKFLPTGNLKM